MASNFILISFMRDYFENEANLLAEQKRHLYTQYLVLFADFDYLQK